uniref:LicD/FKTN/FKRP nucleotidyltransferase domain-containing protein n=1 Tax=viral metagenome TaxID=1070528 RepID=A0A6C0JJ86_9ZZZZ
MRIKNNIFKNINILIIFLIILVFLIIKTSKISEPYTQCNYNHLTLNKTQLKELKELLQEFIKFSNKNDVRYFLIGGSLLGVERNGGLMPTDDDIDIGVLIEDEHKIKNYKNDTYYFKSTYYGYKFKKYNCNTFIDIMIFEKNKYKNNNYSIINYAFKKEYFKENELFPLKIKMYGNIPIFVPNNYYDYLNRTYPKWNEKVKLQCGHYDGYLARFFSKCIWDKHDLPKEFDVTYDNSKYMCYIPL